MKGWKLQLSYGLKRLTSASYSYSSISRLSALRLLAPAAGREIVLFADASHSPLGQLRGRTMQISRWMDLQCPSSDRDERPALELVMHHRGPSIASAKMVGSNSAGELKAFARYGIRRRTRWQRVCTGESPVISGSRDQGSWCRTCIAATKRRCS